MYKKLGLIIFIGIFLQILPLYQAKPINLFGTNFKLDPAYFSVLKPFLAESANFSSASATLSNSRLSFSALLKGSTPTGGSTVIISNTAGTAPDISTNHLFVKDVVRFAGSGNTDNYTVASIIGSTAFNLASGVSTSAPAATAVYRNELTSVNLRFNTNYTIPTSGSVKIYIPATSTYANSIDGVPDSTGFDYKYLASTNITQWFVGGATFPTITISTGPDPSSNASIIITLSGNTSAIPSGTGNYVIVGSTPALINPAPASGHSTGAADIYTVTLQSLDNTSNELEKSLLKVSPIEGVFVSATVLESLSFTVSGVSSGTICGVATSGTTTALGIPFGNVYSGTVYTLGQYLQVTSNSTTGYNITIEENDQMGKDGTSCTGAADETVNCIKDTTCAASACTATTSQDWTTPATYYGLGYSLAYTTWPTDLAFWYLQNSASFRAKQIPDTSAASGLAAAQIMYNDGPVSDHDGYVCYRLAIPGTQPAGYYYNKVKYTASASF